MKLKKSNGFSLVELMIVVALMGIIMAIASPSFMRYRQNTNLREAARDVASDISFFRQRAIAENTRFRITFDPVTNSYTIARENPPNSGAYIDPIVKSPGDANNNSVIISSVPAPSFSGGVPSIVIQPRGTMGAGSLRLEHVTRPSFATISTTIMGRMPSVAVTLN